MGGKGGVAMDEKKGFEVFQRVRIPQRHCLSCNYFRSFQLVYDNDPLEPNDQGFCEHIESPYSGNAGAGADVCCEYWCEEE